MYRQFFHFKEAPFTIAPNPRYLYLSDQHREALAHLTYGLQEENGGFILLVGEVGTGKTTVCRCLLEQVSDSAKIAMILHPRLNEVELLQTICDEFGVDYPPDATIKTLIDKLNTWLLTVHTKGQRAVLVIEEAQNLSTAVLEQLRLLTNLETNEHKLLQIILIGQTELLATLERPELRQFAQRIVARYQLQPLNHREVRAYITHRLQVAGSEQAIFPTAIIKRIAQLSQGIPRLINLLCDRALLGCYAQGKYRVDAKILQQAAREVSGQTRRGFRWRGGRARQMRLSAIVAGIGAVLLVTVFAYWSPSVLVPTIQDARWMSELNAIWQASSASDVVPVQSEETSSSVPVAVEPVTQLSWDALKQGNWGESAAYEAALKHWNLSFTAEQQMTPCEFAQRNGLDCWHKRGSFLDVRRLNRPIVMKMFSPAGKVFYAALLNADDNMFRLGVKNQAISLPKDMVESLWSGEYTVLWKRPPGYTRTVRLGDSSVAVVWLQAQLGLISGQSVSNQSRLLVYDTNLMAQVRKFQRLCRLQVDGLLGKETIIMFNTMNSRVPLLSKDLIGSCPRRVKV